MNIDVVYHYCADTVDTDSHYYYSFAINSVIILYNRSN